MSDIDMFYNCEIILQRKSFKIQIYTITLIVLFIIFLSILCFYKYQPYYNLKATILTEGSNYYLKTLILEGDINNINNNHLIINGQTSKYQVESISTEYLLDENYNKYYEVLLKTKIDNKLIINNNIVDINIKLPKTTLLKQISEKIKKGMK